MQRIVFAMLLLSTVALPAAGQVEVTQATEEAGKIEADDIPSPCPMQIDISLGATPERRAFGDLPAGESWVSTEMKHYVCHTERVSMVLMRNVKDKKRTVELLLQPTIKSEQWRQDVGLTVSLVSADGKEFCRAREDDLTVGKDRAISDVTWVTFASSTKRPEFRCKLPRDQYEELFHADEAPTLRIILDPEVEEE